MLDPDPIEAARVASAAPAEHFASAVTRAVERIRAGELTKVVLAREVRVHAPDSIDPAPVYDGLLVGVAHTAPVTIFMLTLMTNTRFPWRLVPPLFHLKVNP